MMNSAKKPKLSCYFKKKIFNNIPQPALETVVNDSLLDDNCVEVSSLQGDCSLPDDWDISSISDADSSDHIEITDISSTSLDSECSRTLPLPSISKPEPMYPGCTIDKDTSLKLLNHLSLRHNFTQKAVADIMKFTQLHMPFGFKYPTTFYKFAKHEKIKEETFTHVYFCDHCAIKLNPERYCEQCETQFSDKAVKKIKNRFVVFNLRWQLELVLKNKINAVYLEKALKQRKITNDKYSAIYDGKCYKNLEINDNDITCTFNTDGIPVFGSSKSALWPFLISINELPHNIRKHTILLASLWFGEGKPDVKLFLSVVVPMLNELNKHPIVWVDSKGKTINSRIFFVVSAVDAVARCSMQGIAQFNGHYGCSWCTHPGERIKKGLGHCRIYQPLENVPPLRSTKAFKSVVATGNYCQGIKCRSPLLDLNQFDVITGFIPDHMHSVFLGVTRYFLNIWMTGTGSPYYIGSRWREIDNFLLKLKVPYEKVRTSRSILTRKFWKASEWSTWLLVCPLILKTILPKKFLKHFQLLSSAIFLLSKQHVTEDNVKNAEKALLLFYNKITKLYGKEHHTYNIHQLTHLPDAVSNWGPLWGVSAFQFENFNGKLLNFINSSNGVLAQLSKKFVNELKLKQTESKFSLSTELCFMFSDYIQISNKLKAFDVFRGHVVELDPFAENIVSKFCKIQTVFESHTAIINYHKYRIKNSGKRSNNTIQLEMKIGKVTQFYKVQCSCKSKCSCIILFARVSILNTELVKHLDYVSVELPDSNPRTVIVPLETIKCTKFMVLSSDSKYYIQLPNLMETD